MLLMTIATYADEYGFCWPAQTTLARDAEMSVDTVQRQLKILEEQKTLTRVHMPKRRGQWRGYCYRLNMTSDTTVAATNLENSSANVRPGHAASSTDTKPHSLRHKPSIEPSFETSTGEMPAKAVMRQVTFRKQYEGIEIVQHRIASRIGIDGWLILGDMSEPELARVSGLERLGKLDDEGLADAVLRVRLMKRPI